MRAILLGIVMFMFLVVIHELGHFTAAKKTGVHVHEFGVGIPPKAVRLRKDKAGTEYTMNWIPLGGFVRLKGEDPTDTDSFLADDSFITASLGNKLLILVGGVAVNAIFAWLAFATTFWIGVQPITVLPDNVMTQTSTSYLMPSKSFLIQKGYIDESLLTQDLIVGSVKEGSLADSLGIQAGDHFLTINQTKVTASNVEMLLQSAIGQSVRIGVLREENQLLFEGNCDTDSCVLGVELGESFPIPTIQFSFGESLVEGLHEVGAQSKLTFFALGNLGKNLLSFNKEKINGSVKKLSGPVGIVMFGERVLKQGGRVLYLAFAGMISLALALFNILPIPALDGGRMIGVLIQSIGRFTPERYFIMENYVNIVFFLALMILGIWIIFVDLNRIPGITIPFIT